MRSHFSLILLLISCLSFSQKRDTLQCNGILNDQILNSIQDAYQYRINQPQKKSIEFGCGTAAYQYSLDQNCEMAEYILSKYPFLVNEIKKLKNDFPNYNNLNYFWIESKNKVRNRQDLQLSASDTDQLSNWKSERNHENFSAVIISAKTSEHKEFLQLEIKIRNLTKVKKYELTFNKKWFYKEIF